MKKLVTSLAALAIFSLNCMQVQADDDIIPPSQDDRWSGFYAGGHVGYGWADNSWTLINNAGPGACGRCGTKVASYDINGFLGGFQAGYNHQDGQMVYGIEAEVSFGDMSQAGFWVTGPGALNPGPRNVKTDINWLLTLGPRIGMESDQQLWFLEGGVAFVDQDHSHLGGGGTLTGDTNQTGWFVGGGVEHAIDSNWSIKLEYNYIDFGKFNVSMIRPGAPGPATFKLDESMHVAKIGVNYRF